jgi:hypothetical protein
MTKIIALTALLIVVLAAPAAACKEVRDPSASVCVHRDPIAVVTLDNSLSNVAVALRVVFHDWRTGTRRTDDVYVGPGAVRIKQIRVKGGQKGIAVIDLGTREVLVRGKVTSFRQPTCAVALPA